MISMPAAIGGGERGAASRRWPRRRRARPGRPTADGCSTDGRCVSSKSSACASVPLTSAALGAGSSLRRRRRRRPRGARPSAGPTRRTAWSGSDVRRLSARPARQLPSTSRMRLTTSSRDVRRAVPRRGTRRRSRRAAGRCGAVVGHGASHPCLGTSASGRTGAPGGADDAQRRQHEQELGDAGVEQLGEAHGLDDVDAGVDEEHAVHRQQRVPGARRDLLEGDGLAAGDAHAAVGSHCAAARRARARRRSARRRPPRRPSAATSRCRSSTASPARPRTPRPVGRRLRGRRR